MLKIINIIKYFPEAIEPTLKNINLELKNGDFCVVIGSNGSGKSTLMRSISGEYKINSGKILIHGKDSTNKNRSNVIASVVQDINKGTIPEMTLLENIVLSNLRNNRAKLTMYKQAKSKIISEVTKLGIGLEKYINQPLINLSGGQRQIIATLMAIQSKPKLLLLDEHTSALDPKMQKLLMEYTTNAINTNNITSLMITHKLDHAINYGNRIIMLHNGKIVVDIDKTKNNYININTLLELFYKYENLNLITEKNNVH